ncbi:Ca2+-binding RTX toxin-like protein [Amaricoccus macauensis]|uniref:Ca2+-binding RTX toxin-like protein n=1 Tax=Amaricoccus macauensis TaxID=57001 RepID=A0A840SEK7_9RHOB|nr:calcium-binding protein [Amaricoccus macauensis]MBB5220237.1 Ca2+-binding RTX toxin-like protein [Amaricoccus macauensis]
MATIFGTNGADALLGTARADAIHGLWGDDTIEGVDGRDFLYGGMGNDTLDGGAGPDFIDGEGGYDMVLYSSNTTPVWADLRTGVVTFPGQNWPAETLLNIEAIDGGSGSDRFIGNGAGNHFWGSTGNDTLVGNYGADTLLGGGGADSLEGGNGLDSLEGGFGDDTMRGDLHNDLFRIGAIVRQVDDYTLAFVDFGRDIIDGGAGVDTLVVDGPTFLVEEPYSGYVHDTAAPAVRANLGTGTLRIGDSDNRSTLISIENVETGSGHDSINGSTADNFIRAGDGANVVYAGAGDDTIVGGSEIYSASGRLYAEILDGGDGNDAIYGMGSHQISFGEIYFPSQDIFVGGAGNDTLYGAGAIQSMTGGTGDDVFVLTDDVAYSGYEDAAIPEFATTTITDFERRDTIQFETEIALRFVGAVDMADLEIGDVAYYRSGGDTIVEVKFGDENSSASILEIILANYTGPLSANDFDLG